MTARLLLTRTVQDNAYLRDLLEPEGFRIIESPLLSIRHHPYPAEIQQADALLLTSRHAAPACADYAHLPAYIVGEQTAEQAKAHGCRTIAAVAEDFRSLKPLIPLNHPRLLYFSGEHISTDVAAALPRHAIIRHIVYTAEAASSLSPAAQAALADGEPLAVCFFSPRSAAIFHDLCRDTSSLPAAFCLSEAVADICRARGNWREIHVSRSPTVASMLELLRMQNKPLEIPSSSL